MTESGNWQMKFIILHQKNNVVALTDADTGVKIRKMNELKDRGCVNQE